MLRQRSSAESYTPDLRLIFGAVESFYTLWFAGNSHLMMTMSQLCSRKFRVIRYLMLGGVFRLPSFLSGSLKDLLSQMLAVDPLKRITIPEIMY